MTEPALTSVIASGSGLSSDREPGGEWSIRFEVNDGNRRVVEALTTVSNGRFGTRGLLDHWRDLIPGSTVAAGVYDSDDVPALLPGPRWSVVELEGFEGSEVIELDLRTGLLHVELDEPRGAAVRATLFASIVKPGLHALSVDGPIDTIGTSSPLRPPEEQRGVQVSASSTPDGHSVVAVASERGTIAAVAADTVVDHEGQRTLHRFAALEARAAERPGALGPATAEVVSAAQMVGFQALSDEHQERWRDRWVGCAIQVPARPDLELALRFAQYHLLAASSEKAEEVAIGARALTGRAYRGHVFWDTDVFVIPALSAMAPELARPALQYRVNRLSAARRLAGERGFAGARFPWESAADGFDVTPPEGIDLHGKVLPILTGSQEEHIVADVAWAVMNYLDWTGDEDFLRSGGQEIVLETARYWQSRVEWDQDGSAHVSKVIGPDEYHEAVDDNAFTNVMASWNLRTAASLAQRSNAVGRREQQAWTKTADALVDGFDPSRSVHEQFAGFFDLEPVMVDSIATVPVPADALLGHDRIQELQIIKQADVLMLHHLLPDDLRTGSLDRDLDYYLPRTAHGSSLSPAITAAVLARAGRLGDAMKWFELAARFDLDDISGTTAGGLHLATMGGLLQAFTQGFLGLRPTPDSLIVDPHVPAELGTITGRVMWRAVPVQVDASVGDFAVTAPTEIDVTIPGIGHRRRRRISAAANGNEWSER